MEKNTVLLSLEDYNELREFKEKTESGFVPVWNCCGIYCHFYTKDEAIKDIAEQNKGLKNKMLKLEVNDEIVKEECKEEIKEIRKMSIWQFMKWKRCDKGGFVLTNKG